MQLTFDDQLRALVYFNLEEYASDRAVLRVLKQNSFANDYVTPPKGIEMSDFLEAINTRGLDQLSQLLNWLIKKAGQVIPAKCKHLGNLVSMDGSLFFAMDRADPACKAKKSRLHVGFDINRGIPTKVFLTGHQQVAHVFVEKTVGTGETAVMGRRYLGKQGFDQWQIHRKLFVCRIPDAVARGVAKAADRLEESIVFHDAMVSLAGSGLSLAEKPVRLVGCLVGSQKMWLATNRYDLSADNLAEVYALRWDIDTFLTWWKRHLKVYRLVAWNEYGLMVQILGGLITYLLLATYCREQYNEPVSVLRVRELCGPDLTRYC